MTPHPEQLDEIEDRGMRGVAARLTETVEELASLERRRARLRANRRLLSLKLLTGGWTERRVAAVARVSGAAVHQWRRS